MRNLIIFLAVLVFCEYSSAQILYPEPLYEEMDTTIVINKNDKGSFFCDYVTTDYLEDHKFIIKHGDSFSKIFLSSLNDYHYLFELVVGEKKYTDDKGREPEAYLQPSCYFFFYLNHLCCFITDLERRNKVLVQIPEYDSYVSDFLIHREYTYNLLDYSMENHHLLQTVKEVNYFSNSSFDFMTSEGSPYGKWYKKFKAPIIKKVEKKAGKPDYIINNRPRDFQNETCILNKPLRWSQTESNLMFEFRTKDSEVFYCEVDYKKKLYVKHINIAYPDSMIEYRFATNGHLETYAIKKEAGCEIYYYDTKKGYLLIKQTVTKDSPNTYYEEVYDVRREYRKVKIKPEEGNY